AARPEEHIGDTCHTKPRREIARVQGKNRIRTGLRLRGTLRRAHAHVHHKRLTFDKFRISWCRFRRPLLTSYRLISLALPCQTPRRPARPEAVIPRPELRPMFGRLDAP